MNNVLGAPGGLPPVTEFLPGGNERNFFFVFFCLMLVAVVLPPPPAGTSGPANPGFFPAAGNLFSGCFKIIH